MNAVLKYLRYWGWWLNPQWFWKHFVVNDQQDDKKYVVKKIEPPKICEGSSMKLPGTHYPPVLPFFLQLWPTWSVKKYEVFRSQKYGQSKKKKKAETRSPLNKTHKLNRHEWIDKMIVSRDGADGETRGWISNRHRAPLWLRRQQGGGGILVWTGLIKDKTFGPFQIKHGLWINFHTNCQFLEDTFKQWNRKKVCVFQEDLEDII